MEMYAPLSPADFIKSVYWESSGLNYEEWARSSNLPQSTLAAILDDTLVITPETATELSRILGSSPESWLRLQEINENWQLKIANASLIQK